MATQEDIDEAAARVKQLREQLLSDRRDRELKERGLGRDMALAQLETEAARLEAEIAQERALSEPSDMPAPVQSIKAEMERAVALQRAVAEKVTTSDPEPVMAAPPPVTTDEKPVAPTASPVSTSPRVKAAGMKADQEKGK